MPLSQKEFNSLQLKIVEAGGRIRELRKQPRDKLVVKEGGKQIVTKMDIESDDILRTYIQNAFPNDAYVSEETPDRKKDRIEAKRTWLVDPLDATRWVLQGLEGAVMVAAIEDHTPVAGVIYNPFKQEMWSAQKGKGTYYTQYVDAGSTLDLDYGSTKLTASNRTKLADAFIIISQREFVGQEGMEFAIAMGIHGGVTRQPSLGLKAGRIANGTADIYLNWSKDTQEWDVAAADILITEAQGRSGTLLLKPMVYCQQESTALPEGFAIANPYLFEKAIRRFHSLEKPLRKREDLRL
jgi:3'-phosphoadenosine 5'-phosphosulfate (PAPS) 3'-phosphatase